MLQSVDVIRFVFLSIRGRKSSCRLFIRSFIAPTQCSDEGGDGGCGAGGYGGGGYSESTERIEKEKTKQRNDVPCNM